MLDTNAPGRSLAPAGGPRRRRRAGLLTALGLLFAVAVAGVLLVDDEPAILDAAARAAVERGGFVALSAGVTYFEADGPEEGPPVVLVHGTTIPSMAWERTAPALAAAGRRVVRYDLYGRGLSDRPEARYDLDLYVEQLDELLAQLAPGEAADLVGFSLGGMVVAELARRHPERVRRLALVAPAGVGTELPLVARLAVAPGLGELILRLAGTRQLRPSSRNVHRPELAADFDARYLDTIRFRGSRRAVLRTLRSVPLTGWDDGYRALGTLGKPILLVWGRNDAVVPFAASERLRELVRPAVWLPVDDAGHLVAWERPEAVNPALVAHFAG